MLRVLLHIVQWHGLHLALTDESIPSGTPGSVTTPRRSPLAELVNTPRITQDKQTKTANARVLTSTECIRVFEEKEEQKRLAQEEKQKRKAERELKKKIEGRGSATQEGGKGTKGCNKKRSKTI